MTGQEKKYREFLKSIQPLQPEEVGNINLAQRRHAAFVELYPELFAEKAKIDEEYRAVNALLAVVLDKSEAIDNKISEARSVFNKTWTDDDL